jgi:hypothetical protein
VALLPDAERINRVRSERWIDHLLARAVVSVDFASAAAPLPSLLH